MRDEQPRWWRGWLARANSILLILVAILAFVYDLLHRLGLENITWHWVNPEEPLILLIASLCLALGIDRFLTFEKLERSNDLAQNQLATLVRQTGRLTTTVGNVRHELVTVEDKENEIINGVGRINTTNALVGSQAIQTAALALMESCANGEKVKATGQYLAGDGLSPDYYKQVAEIVAESNLEFDVVVPSAQLRVLPTDDRRLQEFKKANVADKLTMRGAKQPWPFEVIIGGHSMIIALLGGESTAKYEIAVKITDPVFVERASDWYRQVIWEGAERPDPMKKAVVPE